MEALLKFESLVRAAMSDHPAQLGAGGGAGGGGGGGGGGVGLGHPPVRPVADAAESGRGVGGYEASSQASGRTRNAARKGGCRSLADVCVASAAGAPARGPGPACPRGAGPAAGGGGAATEPRSRLQPPPQEPAGARVPPRPPTHSKPPQTAEPRPSLPHLPSGPLTPSCTPNPPR
jgi:hypothetical protein